MAKQLSKAEKQAVASSKGTKKIVNMPVTIVTATGKEIKAKHGAN